MQFKSALFLAGLFSTTLALPTIDVIGNKFFYSNNGSQFYMKGVAYQKNTEGVTDGAKFIDPLADLETCRRDIPYLEELGANTIRVYAVNASLDHDDCMKLLVDAGIYVIADLSSPDKSIITDDPQWTVELYERYTTVIDMFQQYDNILGFFAGNEVITNNTNTNCAPFVKAAVRDMRAYMSDQGYRDIPIGYSANDDAKTRIQSADYFSCGDEDVVSSFYGINMYEWCGESDFQTSGYADRTEEFSNLTIPAFFSEFGCNLERPRKFTEVGTIYSNDMTDVWSGGLVYMYFEEDNEYGLVTLDADNQVSTLPDFSYLKSEFWDINPTYATASEASASATTLACPTEDRNWKASTDLPPTPNQDVCDCVSNSAKCAVSDDVDTDDYADLFGIICAYTDCSDISADGESGEYGAFSFCSSKEKLNFLLNKYYEEQDEDSSACDFDGSATELSNGSTASTCEALISSVFEAATATGSSPRSTGSTGSSPRSTGSSSSSSSSSSSASSSSSSSSSSSGAGRVSAVVSGTELGLLAIASTFFVGGLSYILV